MQKVVEKATLIIIQAMGRNREAYNEAHDWFNDTGHNRYQKKMDKLDAEYEELKAFLHTEEKVDVQPEIIRECDELKQTLLNIKSKWDYLKADMPMTVDTIGIDDLLRDVR